MEQKPTRGLEIQAYLHRNLQTLQAFQGALQIKNKTKST